MVGVVGAAGVLPGLSVDDRLSALRVQSRGRIRHWFAGLGMLVTGPAAETLGSAAGHSGCATDGDSGCRTHPARRGGSVCLLWMATCLTLLLQRWRGAWPTVREWFVRWAALIVPAIAISALFVLPRLKSVAYLFLNPLQIAHMPTDREAKFRDFPRVVGGARVCVRIGVGVRSGAPPLAGASARGHRCWNYSDVLRAFPLCTYSIPHAHFRNYSEPAQFMLALLVPIPLFLAIETFLEARRSGMIAVGAGLLLVGGGCVPRVSGVGPRLECSAAARQQCRKGYQAAGTSAIMRRSWST